MKQYNIINGNSLDVLLTLEENSVDAIITDPPYELGFMGKSWDASGIAYNVELWKRALRVLKPGGYLLAFGGSRTFHRIACAVEDAGFEIRDTIMWLYGCGFPKSLNLGKKTGQEQWKGWGSCLKPGFEPIIMARKPFKGSLTENVLEYGVGGLNIDACRIENEDGRFPANVIHDGSEEVLENFPESDGGQGKGFKAEDYEEHETATNFTRGDFVPYNDKGSASRYFYCAKASSKDRDEGMGEDANFHPTVKPMELMQYLIRLVTPKGGCVLDIFNGSGSTGKAVAFENRERDMDYSYIGIELDPEYCKISEARIDYAANKYKYDIMEEIKENEKKGQLSLFDL